jgi:hypothetical protein
VDQEAISGICLGQGLSETVHSQLGDIVSNGAHGSEMRHGAYNINDSLRAVSLKQQ